MYSVEVSPLGSSDKWLALTGSPQRAGWGHGACLQPGTQAAVSAPSGSAEGGGLHMDALSVICSLSRMTSSV